MTPEVSNVIVAVATVVNSVVSLICLVVMREVRHNTNSIKDELVAATAEASEARGTAKGLALGRAESRPGE